MLVVAGGEPGGEFLLEGHIFVIVGDGVDGWDGWYLSAADCFDRSSDDDRRALSLWACEFGGCDQDMDSLLFIVLR